jgi:hypothetical protein
MLVDGERLEMRPVCHWDELFFRCTNIADETGMAVKLLPMTALELLNYTGLDSKAVCRDPTIVGDDYSLMVKTCVDVLRKPQDDRNRAKACDLLQSLLQIQNWRT